MDDITTGRDGRAGRYQGKHAVTGNDQKKNPEMTNIKRLRFGRSTISCFIHRFPDDTKEHVTTLFDRCEQAIG